MAVMEQLTFFDGKRTPAQPKASKAKKRATGPAALARGEFEPVNPPNLAQNTALWLLGQRSITAQRGGRYIRVTETHGGKKRSATIQRGGRYVPASIKHPGKMQPDVAGAIIDTYTKPGEFIVDCMGGIGSTGVEGAERGRHVLCVELVRHWANVSYANAVRTALRGAPGTMQVVQGDARDLAAIVATAADVAFMSPPYGQALEARSTRTERRVERIQAAVAAGQLDDSQHGTWAGRIREQGGVIRHNGLIASMNPRYDADAERHQVDAVVSSPVYGDSRLRPVQSGPIYVPGSPLRPDAYPAGYDAALLSPPFGEAINQSPVASDAEARRRRLEEAGHEGYKFGPNSVQAQTQQYDAAVVSPPYGQTNPDPDLTHGLHLGRDPGDVEFKKARQGQTQPGYDAMIASPAYGDVRQDGGAHQFGSNSAMDNYTGEARVKSRGQRDPSNVGNKKYGTMKHGLAMVERLKAGETIPPEDWPKLTYLEDMALIYWGCLQVLKEGGLCILVLKDYRREKRRVDLVGDTITLMKAVGFVYHDRALAVTSKVKDAKVIVKVSPFVRLNARKPEKNGGAVMLPVGEEVLVYRKEAQKR